MRVNAPTAEAVFEVYAVCAQVAPGLDDGPDGGGDDVVTDGAADANQ